MTAIVDRAWNFYPEAGAITTESTDEILDYVGSEGLEVVWVLESYVWGRFSDRSSRQTLMAAGALGAAAAMFAAQIAYEGVRAGRKLHLTDMAEDAFRARAAQISWRNCA